MKNLHLWFGLALIFLTLLDVFIVVEVLLSSIIRSKWWRVACIGIAVGAFFLTEAIAKLVTDHENFLTKQIAFWLLYIWIYLLPVLLIFASPSARLFFLLREKASTVRTLAYGIVLSLGTFSSIVFLSTVIIDR